jgi:riboflavin biosynthesis pyrimidine reductase
VPLFAEPDARILVYTEAADATVETRGAQVEVHRVAPGGARPPAVLEHLATARGVRSVLCEGGPSLLRALVAETCIDDFVLTVAPLLGGGGAPNVLEGEPLDPPARLELRDLHRAGEHLFMHYVPAS